MKCWPIGKQYFEIWIDFFYQNFRIDNSKNGARRWPYELDPKLQAEHGENLAEFLALDLNKDGTISLDEFAQAQDLATVEADDPVAGVDFNTDEFGSSEVAFVQ